MKQLSLEHWKVVLQYKATSIPRGLVVVIGIAVGVGLISCDLFKTRTPAEPSEDSSTRIPPTEPSLVLQNMVSAFNDGNNVNYAYSFSNGFVFEATVAARSNYGTTFSSWSKSSESDYFSNIISHLQKNSSVELTFDSYTPTYFSSGDSSKIETVYCLTVPHTMANVAKYFSGKATFTLGRDQSYIWFISRWQDDGTDSTWSDLKGAFAQ